MKVTIPQQTKEITQCYHECPFFGLEGGPSPTMCCQHPYWNNKGAYAGCIISHPECDNGFPPQCPLFQENGMIPPEIPIKKSYVTAEEVDSLPLEELIRLEMDRMLLDQLLNIDK
jgi:hypothetical protein